ncbi:ABC transporter permease [Streptomyces sp. NRRL F-5727]|uniref:ABC transporter permease n=1 Tax=Streptomyces sp. NRRL F-5727 TaxID=1463871 RepID=UPI000A6515AA|nr:ABC transporter permease [Streptomyces sp. NRRL F-5727]
MNARTLRRACRAEWTKLRTETGVRWLVVALVVVTVAVGAATSSTVRPPVGDPARTALGGVAAGQAVAAVLGVLSAGGEYGTRMIQLTLAAVPDRSAVLAAKAAVLSVVVAAAGTVAVAGSLAAGKVLLPGAPALTDGPALRAGFGSVLYLVLVALLALGVTLAVRDSAVASGAALTLLYLFPLLSKVVADPWLQRQLARVGPMPAGLAVQATTDLSRLPLGPWVGLGVLTLWAAAAVLVGGAVLRRRDA